MTEYHCYVLTKESQISRRLDIRADTDADALVKAAEIVLSEEFPVVEVWCGKRFVGCIPRPPVANQA